jgi:hypothetical protein
MAYQILSNSTFLNQLNYTAQVLHGLTELNHLNNLKIILFSRERFSTLFKTGQMYRMWDINTNNSINLLSFVKFVSHKGGDYLQKNLLLITADLISANSVL